MKRLRRDTSCLNCGTRFSDPSYRYCPNCGQANTNNRVSLAELWRDVFENYIAIDSRMGHTIVPFLFRPGRLTQDFSQGRRVHYVHPMKLYLLTSLLFFFAFSHLVMPEFNREINDWQTEVEQELNGGSGQVKAETSNIIQIEENEEDSLKSEGGFQRFYRLASRRDLSPTAFADSMNINISVNSTAMIGDKTLRAFALFTAQQLQKIFRNDVSLFISSIVQNTPLVILVILPLLAILLKLFYWRKDRFYVEHLVLALHWQSFAYVLLMAGMVVYNLGVPYFWVTLITLMLFTVYSVLLFSRFYDQHWFLTIVKLNFIGMLYYTILSFAVGLNAALSFFLF